VIARLSSYAELSPSGTGAHVLIKAKLSGRGRRAGKIEIYDSARYFTMTGKHINGTPQEILYRQDELNALNAELFSPPSQLPDRPPSELGHFPDEEVIERAKSARNGERFMRLWSGDTSEYGDDHSRADAALCCILAFWTRGDRQRVDRLFRQSGLMREKWDRPTGSTTYAALTVRTAVERLNLD
jgi:primase-polymerase (primpol)-like protein